MFLIFTSQNVHIVEDSVKSNAPTSKSVLMQKFIQNIGSFRRLLQVSLKYKLVLD